ncbi:MAG: hypothetical protein ACRDNW_08580 [Trebonia sp.]
METIAFIGLGIMDAPAAGNLITGIEPPRVGRIFPPDYGVVPDAGVAEGLGCRRALRVREPDEPR